MSKARILVVEDEPSLRMGMVDGLLSEGFDVEEAADGEAGLQAAMDQPFDAMVLDLMLPKLDGFEVLRRLRERRNGLPVLILSARGQDSDRILGFEYGADDYVVKPTPLREVVLRLQAILRRANAGGDGLPERLVFDGIEVDFLAYTLVKNEQRHGLNRKELELLRYFLKHVGQNLSRAQILEDVWGLKGVRHTRTIDTHVFRLRKKIEDDPDSPQHIHTVRGVGYRFEAVQVTQL
ncbi:MAG: DNA-binding response regulator [Planctomycetes bacterium]|nr:DNA-binding response regulator [Planctomycetota bacterium]